jgi:hypothetical protein
MIGLLIYATLGMVFLLLLETLAWTFGGPFLTDQDRIIIWLLWPMFVLLFIYSLIENLFK